MPQIETQQEDIRQLTGLHLYHDPISSCAQRVRLVLGEKHIPWTSHVVDLSKSPIGLAEPSSRQLIVIHIKPRAFTAFRLSQV